MMDVLGEGSECILAEDRALYFQEMGWRFSQIYDATGERGTDTQTDQFYSSAYTVRPSHSGVPNPSLWPFCA